MALSQSTLANEIEAALDALSSDSAPVAEVAQAEAFGEYFKDASHNGVPVLPGPVDTIAVPAMAAAMVFVAGSTPAQGAAQLASGYSAFWGAIVASPALFWPASGVTPPPGLGGLTAAFVAMFAVNNNPSISKSQAAANMAAILHPNAGLGGTALIGVGPAFAPIL